MNETVKTQVMELAELLYQKKAFDILPIHVADKTVIADWFLVASGRVPQQVKKLADELEEKAGEFGLTLTRTEGYDAGRWIVLDFSDILVHLFMPEERKYYNMERLWDEDEETPFYDRIRDAEEAAKAVTAAQTEC